MALQEMNGLEGAAREFAEAKGYGPLDVDVVGWTLLHHAAAESQHRRGMLGVVRGLLAVMPRELVDQGTKGGTPEGWSALSLLSNARDAANERAEIARSLVERRADFEVRNPTAPRPWSRRVRAGLLDARADHLATNNNNRNALDVTPKDQEQVV